MALSLFSNAKANDFLSSEVPDELFNIGVRIGLNTSNRTFNKDFFRSWNTNSWGTGIDAGVVVNLNMRDFFALQPGFFFESRSGNYSYSQEYLNGEGEKKDFTQMGHYRTHNFTIPVMASLRFNLSGDLRWVIEAGPYLQYTFKTSGNKNIQVIKPQENIYETLNISTAKSNPFDFGLKIGTGVTFKRKILPCSCTISQEDRRYGKPPHAGGHNKAWTFCLGYDF